MNNNEYIVVLKDTIATLEESKNLAIELKDYYCSKWEQEKENNMVLKAALFCALSLLHGNK